MCCSRNAFLIGFLGAILTVFTATVFTFAQDEPIRLELQQKFDQGLKLYRQGEYEKAAKVADEILKLNPSAEEALILRERAGIGILVKLMRDKRTRAMAEKILKDAAKQDAKVRRDAAKLKALVVELDSEEFIKRRAAMAKLTGSGPFAVPFLLDAVINDQELISGSRKVSALIALRAIGTPAIPPLVTALANVDDSTAVHLVKLIREYPDSRAVPVLVAIVADEQRDRFLRNQARAILESMGMMRTPADAGKRAKAAKKPALPSTTKAYLDLATRYYQKDGTLIEFMPPNERVLWRWNPEGKSFAERLTFEDVPGFAYPRLLAENLLLRAMECKRDLPAVVEIYICNSYCLLDEDLAGSGPKVSDPVAIETTNESFGANYLYRALGRALREKNAKLVWRCIEALRRVADQRPPKGPNTLGAALAHPDCTIRVSAADTLMQISPKAELGGARQVVNVLAGGLGTPVRPNVAVVTEDEALYRGLAKQLAGWSIVSERFRAAGEAIGRAKSLRLTSMIIIDTRIDGEKVRVVVNAARKDARTATLPIVLLAVPRSVERFKRICGTKVSAVLPLKPPAGALKTTVESVLAAQKAPAAGENILKNRELLLGMLKTLAGLPEETGYPVRGLSTGLAALLKGYPDDIRILALDILLRLDDTTLRDKVYDIFVSAQEAIEVRRRAGLVFARLLGLRPSLESDQIAKLRGMMSDADEAIRSIAIRGVAIAAISQSDREAYLLNTRGKK